MILNKNAKSGLSKWLPLLAVLFLLPGCSGTITPQRTQPKVPSFSASGAQDSGVIEVLPRHYRNITAESAARYNALIETYGKRFPVPLKPNDGLRATATNTFIIDPEHWVQARQMNLWRKSGQ